VQPSVVQKSLDQILEELADDRSGAVADYIPELAKVDPERFGIAVATVDGHVYATGDCDDLFTIQSISKPFVYGMALDDRGSQDVMRHVGVEPSGDAFNSIVMDEVNNRPLNPMVNAGAIACASLVEGATLGARRRRVLSTFGRYAGRELTIDEAVCESERRTGNRNRAIAYLQLNSGMITEPVEEHLAVYFAQCSVRVTARDLAVMAATLANGGHNPVTGEVVLGSANVSRVLTVMATCGMYDWSGEWLYRVGLPAKSGVGGGIIAVLPGQLGIGVFSPRLDPHGNSVRGVRVCEELGQRFSLHLLATTSTAVPIVRHRYDGREVHSKRLRRNEDRELLNEMGESIVVLQLQGDLYFGTAEKLARTVEQLRGATIDDTTSAGTTVDGTTVDGTSEATGDGRGSNTNTSTSTSTADGTGDGSSSGVTHVVLDVRRIGRAAPSALTLLADLRREMADAGCQLLVAGVPEPLAEGIAAAGVGWPPADVFPDTDRALERCEDDLLLAHQGEVSDGVARVELAEVDVLRSLAPSELAELAVLLETETYGPDEVVWREGEPADRLCFLLVGSATVHLAPERGAGDDRGPRLRTFGPGTVFGEAAIFAGGRRSATVTADEPLQIQTLSNAARQQLAVSRPDVHAALVAGLGPYLSELLAAAMAEIRALDS
jgi:glutaminase